MTEITRAYEFVVFDADEVGVTFTFTDPDFGFVPMWGAWRVNQLQGTSESEPFIVNILDTSEQVTAGLSDAGGRALLIGRLWRLRINEDGGGLTTVAQGRITGVSLGADVASFDFACGDERFLTRQRPVYTSPATPTTQIWPTGLRSKWLDLPTAPIGSAIVLGANTFEILVAPLDRGPDISSLVAEFIRSDLKPQAVPGSTGSSSGHFTNIRANVNGTDREVLSFNALFNGHFFLGKHQEDFGSVDGSNKIYAMYIALPTGHGISEGDLIDLYLHAPNAPPSPALPYHIGGQHGGNLWSELKDRYDEEGIRYDANAFGTWDAATNPGGLLANPIIHDAHIRLDHIPTLGELEDLLCHEYGMALFPNAAGEITPRSIFLPFGIDPTTLTQVTSAKFRAPHPTFQQVGALAKTVLQTSYREARMLTDSELQGQGWPGDGIAISKVDLPEQTHDRVADLGRFVHRLDLSTVFRKGFAVNREFLYKRELFDMYGDGPVRGVFSGLSSLDGILAGDHVVLDLSSYPDLGTQARGGKRIVKVLERRMTPHGGEFEYVDAGADDNALTKPTVSIIKNATRPKHAVDVTISAMPAGAEGYTLQLKLGSREYSTFHEGPGNETVTIENLPSGTTPEAQARAFKTQSVRSLWSTSVSVALDALTAPSAVSATASGLTIEATFTAGEANYPVMPTLDGVDFLRAPLPAGSTRFVFTDLAASTLFTVGFRHVDPYGGASAIGTDTATTGTAATLSAPGDITVLQGAPSSGDIVHPLENAYGAGVELSVPRTEPHAYLDVQSSTDSFANIEMRRLVEGRGVVRMDLPLDGVQREFRARHMREGFASSVYTAVVTATPTPFAREASVRDGFAGGTASITVDSSSGLVHVHINSPDPDAVESYHDLNNSAFAEPDTGDTNVSATAFPYSAASALTLAHGETAYFWLKFWHPVKGFGQGVKMSLTYVDATGPVALNGVSVVQSWVVDTAAGADKYNAALVITCGGDVKSLDIVATDAPLNVDSHYIVNLTAGELTNRSLREIVKASKTVPPSIDPTTDANYDATDSDGCFWTVTPYDAIDGSEGAGTAGTAVNLDGFIQKLGSDVNTSEIGDMKGVSITAAATRDVLYFDGANWVDAALDAADVQSGTFADGRIAASNVTQHVASIDHDALLNFDAAEHFTQAAITTVGTIGTGVWQGTAVGSNYGGTGLTNASIDAGGVLVSIDGSSWVSLAPTVDGYVLTLSGGAPVWAAGGGGGGTVTEVTVGAGLDVATGTTTPHVTLDLQEIAEAAGTIDGADRLVGESGGVNFAETISGIPLSIFNDDLGHITSVTAGTNLNGGGSSGAVTLNLDASISLTNVTVTSDQRLKSHLGELLPAWALEAVSSLRPVRYKMLADEIGTESIGLYAQEVSALIPHAVVQDPKSGYLGIDYTRTLVTYLVGAVIELESLVRELQAA